MMTPTLRQLEYVVALADSGQFVEASRRCGVSQPALSKQVREVEELLGVVLFERTRPRVLLTEVGEEVVARARRLLADARELMVVAQASSQVRRGVVRLGVIPTIAPYGLPGLLAKLRVRYPQVSFAIEETQTESLLDGLRSGSLDLGLLARPFGHQGLDGEDLVMEPFVLVAPADHALGVPRSIRPGEIAGASLLLMQDGHCLRDQAIDVCLSAGAPPATTVEAASLSTLVRMVESGLGPTLLPVSALSVELRESGGLVARSFEGLAPGRTLTLQWRSTSSQGAWFAELGHVLREHYLGLNEGLPEVYGSVPRMVGVGKG